MSENKDDSTNNSEREPEVIYVQYDGDLGTDTDNPSILLEVTEAPLVRNKNIKEDSSTRNSSDIILNEDIDSPDLVNIEDFQHGENFENSLGNGEDQSTAVLCETTLEPDQTGNLNGAPKDNDIEFFQIVNVEEKRILDDIPNEALVYTCQPENEDFLNKYPCKTCGIVTGCIFCLKSHYESVHLNLGLIQYKCNQTSYLKNYTEICHKCNLVCESKEEMFEHRKIHFVSCDVCDMSFDSALFLSNHCKTSHEKFEVIISCDLCEQWFKQLQDLSDHYASYHEMILCIVCFKRFATQIEREGHHGTHKIVLKHTESVLPYACSKCNKAFAEISDLSTHLTQAHSTRKRLSDKNVVAVKMDQPKKKGRNKQALRFYDCGGLTQVIVHDNKGKKTKKTKPDD